MLTYRLASAVAALSISASAAMADSPFPDGTYLRAFGGATGGFSGDSATGPAGGIAFGRQFDAVRVEAELSRRTSDMATGGDRRADAVMVNVYQELAPLGSTGRVTPYVGAGFGALRLDADGSSDTGAAVQAMLGARYAVTSDVALTGEVRYVASDAEINLVDQSVTANGFDAIIGLELNF